MKTQPKYKVGRRLGAGVYDKCQTQKFAVSEGRKKMGRRGPKRMSAYGTQLIEKQKIRFTYGLTEKQFRNYIKFATEKSTISNPSDSLKELLELRLDNVLYRAGFAPTRQASRQMSSHGHILVNGKRTTVPSYSLKSGDVLSIREGSKQKKIFIDLAKKLKNYTFPNWVSVDTDKGEITISGTPKVDDAFLDFNAVLEFYSR